MTRRSNIRSAGREEVVQTERHGDGKSNAYQGYVHWHLCPTRRADGMVYVWRPWSGVLCSMCRKAASELVLAVGTYPPAEAEITPEPLP